MKKAFLPVLLLFSIVVALILEGCASMARPTGGPRDSLPPVLLKATPEEFSLNAARIRNTITFDFDEFVELDNIFENLIVSPTLKSTPNVTRKLRTVTVKIKDTLEENTTYTLNFGKAIKDLNEGNPFQDFSYTFSTGNYLDSMMLLGNVVVAQTGQIDTTLIVMLHNNLDDSAVIKQKPRYYTRVNGKGEFLFHHLPPGQFKLYALKDEGGMQRYLNPDQLFAFSDSVINVSDSTPPITLYAYVDEAAREEEEKRKSSISPKAPKPRKKQEEENFLRYTLSLEGGTQDLLKPLTFTFAEPLALYDSTGITLLDSTLQPVPGYTLSLDTSRTVVTLNHKWPAGTDFNLVVADSCMTDSTNRGVLRDTIQFATRKASEYGQLRIRFVNYVDTGVPRVLQLIANNEVKYSIPISATPFFAPIFQPGEYEIRILNDTNGNGKWDPGTFFTTRQQPETVTPYEKKLTVKGNWENEFVINL